MSEVVALIAETRKEIGTGASRELRRHGKIPAVIYGSGNKPVSITIEEKEITKYYRKPQYMSQVFELELEGKKVKVLPKDIDLHPVTEIPRHADFVFIGKKTQKMLVPVVYANKDICAGIKRGGYFNIVKRFLKMECLVSDLPRAITIDTSKMEIGASMKAKEVTLPIGAKLLENAEFVIASIIGKRGKSQDIDDTSGAEGDEAEGEAKEEK